MAGHAGLPTEGTPAALPRAGDLARQDTPTCTLDEMLADVRGRVLDADADRSAHRRSFGAAG